jgi:hypothetical protein
MKNPTKSNTPSTMDALDSDLLKDLERQSIDEIRKLRAHERIDVRIELTIRPGNSSQLGEIDMTGQTCDLSAGGCRVLTPQPIGVGDIFRLQFDRAHLDLGLVFARCVRCRLLREDSFETGFTFFTPIKIGEPKKGMDGDLLG